MSLQKPRVVLEVDFDPGRVRLSPALQRRRAIQRPDPPEEVAEDSRGRGRLGVDLEADDFIALQGRLHHLARDVPVKGPQQLLGALVLGSTQQSLDGGMSGVESQSSSGHEPCVGVREVDLELPSGFGIEADRPEVEGVRGELGADPFEIGPVSCSAR